MTLWASSTILLSPGTIILFYLLHLLFLLCWVDCENKYMLTITVTFKPGRAERHLHRSFPIIKKEDISVFIEPHLYFWIIFQDMILLLFFVEKSKFSEEAEGLFYNLSKQWYRYSSFSFKNQDFQSRQSCSSIVSKR